MRFLRNVIPIGPVFLGISDVRVAWSGDFVWVCSASGTKLGSLGLACSLYRFWRCPLGDLKPFSPKPKHNYGSVPIRRSVFWSLLLLALASSACNHVKPISAPPASTTTINPHKGTKGDPPTTTIPNEPTKKNCSPRVADTFRSTANTATLASFEIAQAAFDCADEVGLAPPNNAAALATLAAVGIDGPILLPSSLTDPALVDELARLTPERIVVAGFGQQTLRGTLTDHNVETVAVDPQATFSSPDALAQRVWLTNNQALAQPLTVLADQIGVGVIAARGDLRGLPKAQRQMITAATQVDLITEFGEDASWQLNVLRSGNELPGGGVLMFDADNPRRLVAMYGHPSTRSLGVLGEQSAVDSVERLATIANGYEADGSTVLPTFEIIATVAAAQAGFDGNYSNETSRETIRPWIETASANDIYVVLDLQPGRSTFLSQAMIYEEFLRLPNVGLAIDPEWRLKPHQRHLRQIGTVDAVEINEVVDWLAAIVREEALPQKLLILHQFRFSMITNRPVVKTPLELAVLVHMDGQGSLPSKYNTWNALTSQSDVNKFYWGWKNFYDEDSPVATPAQVLALSPSPLFVSFQ